MCFKVILNNSPVWLHCQCNRFRFIFICFSFLISGFLKIINIFPVYVFVFYLHGHTKKAYQTNSLLFTAAYQFSVINVPVYLIHLLIVKLGVPSWSISYNSIVHHIIFYAFYCVFQMVSQKWDSWVRRVNDYVVLLYISKFPTIMVA